MPDGNIYDKLYKIILSKPRKESDYIRVDIAKSGERFQASMFTARQVFHKNLDATEVGDFIDSLFGETFLQYTAWDNEREYTSRVTKKGKVLTSSRLVSAAPKAKNFAPGSFDVQKNHIIKEGEVILALVDMGVFTKDYKIATAMYDKFQQINRFIELIADETKKIANKQINIIDFGCGKSYLTFLVYYYFAEKRKLPINICGMDLDESVVDTCAKAAEKYGYKSLSFVHGDIGRQAKPPVDCWGRPGTFNIVISLHACDTATDHAIANAIKWNADLICAVPCCQHELRGQMSPKNLRLFSEYGIIKERIASLATDAIRAKLLEWAGYKTQIIEFTEMEHTPKNLFIRAKYTGVENKTALEEVEKILGEFSFNPKLLSLLKVHPMS